MFKKSPWLARPAPPLLGRGPRLHYWPQVHRKGWCARLQWRRRPSAQQRFATHLSQPPPPQSPPAGEGVLGGAGGRVGRGEEGDPGPRRYISPSGRGRGSGGSSRWSELRLKQHLARNPPLLPPGRELVRWARVQTRPGPTPSFPGTGVTEAGIPGPRLGPGPGAPRSAQLRCSGSPRPGRRIKGTWLFWAIQRRVLPGKSHC